MQDTAATPEPAKGRLPLFLCGILLFVLGPIIYALQFLISIPPTPWHVPILATLGIVLMAMSALQHGGIARGIFLALFSLFCAFQWFMLLVGMVTPAYTGPAQPGSKVPAFTTTRADGRTFTNHDLDNGQASVLIFFRGRW